jgi:hypothetical protein
MSGDSWTVRTIATNTIAFIDSTLIAMESQLKETGKLKSFRKGKNIYDIEEGGAKFSDKMLNLMSVEMK